MQALEAIPRRHSAPGVPRRQKSSVESEVLYYLQHGKVSIDAFI